MKKHMKPKMTGLLVFLLVFTCLLTAPVSFGMGCKTVLAATTGEYAGSFYLTASVSSKTLIEPVAIPYLENQTIKEALKASGYSFGGIDQDYITDIQDVAGNYTIYYDHGGYALNEPASSITGIIYSERLDCAEADLELMKAMAEFQASTDHVQKYAPAASAYQDGLIALRQSGYDANAIKDRLNEKMILYRDLFKGPQYQVSVLATQGTQTLNSVDIKLTDEYDNVYTQTGNSISVIAGNYSFVISDGKSRSVEGSIQVSVDTTLEVSMPAGEWISDLKLLENTKISGVSASDPDLKAKIDAAAVESELKLEDGTAVFYIPDHADKNFCLLYGEQGKNIPDEDNTLLKVRYNKLSTGVDTTLGISWESKAASVPFLVQEGAVGADFQVWAQYKNEKGHVQKQTIACCIKRIPTLAYLEFDAEGTKLPLKYEPGTNSYELSTVSDQVTISAEPSVSTYEVTGTGKYSFSKDETEKTFSIQVSNPDGLTNTYQVKLKKVDAVSVYTKNPTDCNVHIFNEADAEFAPVDGVYHLIEGQTYYYICEKQARYYSRASFTVTANMTLQIAEPEAIDALLDYRIYDASNSKSRNTYQANTAFDPAILNYDYTLLDSNSSSYFQATCSTGYTASVTYKNMQVNSAAYGEEKNVKITATVSNTNSTTLCSYMLLAGGYTQNALMEVRKEDSGVLYYQQYRLTFNKSLQLSALSASDTYGTLAFYDSEGNKIDFNRRVKAYYITVDRSLEALSVSGTFYKSDGYYAIVQGEKTVNIGDLSYPLNAEKDMEELTLEVCHEAEAAQASTYKLIVTKTDPVAVTFKTIPADANVYLVNNATSRHVSKEDDSYPLTPGVSYSYTVTKNGYTGKTVEEYIGPEEPVTITVELEKSPENTTLPNYSAKWPSFRADDYNNGVVDDPTPVSAEKATLYWATQLGEGYSADACGCPIIVNDYLYTYAGTHIYKVDMISGEVVATGDMDHKSSFAINSPTYAEGMIFVGLSDGTIQAFNAKTMESVWIYHDPLKGQPNCPIAYKDGYIYTGFWLGERSPANFVCVSVTDEDPTNTLEEKIPTWRYTHNGYYWAGAYVCDNYVLIGTDDGDSGYLSGHASILSLDPMTGDLIDSYTLEETGDQRSSISFIPDEEGGLSGYGYFTTKGGYFYRIRVEADGTFSQNEVKSLKLYNYASDDNAPPMSTCTPTIYNDRAYVGVSGVAQFGAYSGHNITVIDLEHWTIAYSVRTQGYPQTSGLLSTAYEETTGDVYVYFFDNYTPGKLRLLTDHKGQTEPSITCVESYVDKGETITYTTAYNLFTPYGDQAQYAICSPLTDEYGTIYFKNDSAYLMALGNNIAALEIVSEPDNMDYVEGEVFDGTGIRVQLHYNNGKTRDVTKYVSWSTEPLTVDDTEFTIEFPYTMYHDENGVAGTAVEHPFATLSINVSPSEEGAPEFVWKEVDGIMNCQAVFDAANTTSETEETYDCNVISETEKEASCAEEGLVRYVATVQYAGKTFSRNKKIRVDALGHAFKTMEGKDATCTEVGWAAYEICDRCDYSTYQELKPLGHVWDQGEVIVDATEKETGVRRFTCTRCTTMKDETIPVKEHTHVLTETPLQPAGWSTEGKTAITSCSICGQVISGGETIPVAGTPKLSTTSYTYSGKAKKPTVKQLDELTLGTDYTVTYSNNVKVGKASVRVELIGRYTGTKTLTFTIKPPITTIKKLTSSGKAITVTWTKKTSQVTGYQIQYSRKSSMASAKTVTVTGYKTTSKKLSKLTKNKYYYVRIRTYKTVNKTKYYASWSSKKKIKVK